MSRKLIVALTLATSLLASGTVTAAPAHLKEETTDFLCEALGFSTAGGVGFDEKFLPTHIKNLVDEINHRPDYNQKRCKDLFKKGAYIAASLMLSDVLEEK